MAYYGVRPGGNFEGHSILYVPLPPEAVAERLGMSETELAERIERGRRVLLAQREQRVKPGRDEKILTSWNGLMLRAFAESAAALERVDFRAAAVGNAEFVLRALHENGRLWRSYKDGQAKLSGYLEDYAFFADGLLALYRSTLDPRWLRTARSFADTMIDQFWDDEAAEFFDTSRDHERLVSRPRDVYDNATPSGTSVAVEVLLNLATLTDQARYRDLARSSLESLAEPMAKMPTGFGRLLSALDRYLARSQEVAIIGQPGAADTQALLRVVWSEYRPYTALALATGPDDPLIHEIPLLAGRDRRNDSATAYVCENFACSLPTTEPPELARQLKPDGESTR